MGKRFRVNKKEIESERGARRTKQEAETVIGKKIKPEREVKREKKEKLELKKQIKREKRTEQQDFISFRALSITCWQIFPFFSMRFYCYFLFLYCLALVLRSFSSV